MKPDLELAVLARKPLDGTVANNVANWGCGALAIDACRIGPGRWPANVMLDEEAGAALDAQSGNRPGGGTVKTTKQGRSSVGPSQTGDAEPFGGYKDAGGASRFFYCAKTSNQRMTDAKSLTKILHGDVIDSLKEAADNSFDACLCDPPYGLSFMGNKWDYDVPSTELWSEVFRVLKPGAPLIAFGGTRTYHRMVVRIEDAGFEIRDCLMWVHAQGFPKSLNVSKAIDDADLSKQWDGYGTALKPAFEPAVLARKPLEGTVANNVAKWGCGALAIDACRIGTGRWPANLMLDEVAAAAMDAQSGNRPSATNKGPTNGGAIFHGVRGKVSRQSPSQMRFANGAPYAGETGGASRFFYCTKVSKPEREAGCEALGDSEGKARNHHPTLKPIALTRWLASLIKPPTGDATLLVPFSGAGSEMIGAMQAGWPSVVGIERDAEYVAIAKARIKHAKTKA